MSDDMEILKALPVLQKIWNTTTLSDYFKRTVAPLAHIDSNIEQKMMIDAISKQAAHLYGQDTANDVHRQLESFPVVETGTHLAFLRDYDSPQKDDLRSRLNQNVLISSALMRNLGQRYHIGVYGSNVSLSHPCGGGFFQLGDDIFPVASLKQIDQSCLYDAPRIDKGYFNESLPLTAKLKILNEVLTQDIIDQTSTPRKEMLLKTKKVLHSLLSPLKNSRTNYGAVAKQYSSLNQTNQTIIKTTMLALSAEAYKKYGYTFSDIDKQYKGLQEIFGREDLKLPDQVALVQSKTINQILDGTNIKHLSVDAVEVVRNFLISSLEDKNSLWYKVFSNPEHVKKMHQTFIGLRGSWKTNESPFDYIGKEKGFSKCISLPLDAIDHKPETLIPLLKDRKIIPSNALIVLAFQSSGVMAHGGFFQTTYADKIKKRFVGFLQEIGEGNRSEQLQKLPVDMALLSLAVIKDASGAPMKLSAIARKSVEKRTTLMNIIPNYPSCRAVTNALPILRGYLESTAPGYIESEAAQAEQPKLNCQCSKDFRMFSVRQQARLLGRTG